MLKRSQEKPSKLRIFVRWLRFSIVLLLFLDAVVYEPRFPVLVTQNVAVPNLPKELDGFKMVQLSDIHRRKVVPDSVIRRAVSIANSTHADAAMLTGDYVGKNPSDIDRCFDLLSPLKTRLGSYAVLGNHDHWTDAAAVKSSISNHGIHILDNDSVRLADGLYLAGIDDEWAGKPDVDAAFQKVKPKSCCIMLAHSPLSVGRFNGHNGLLLTGHTHGGQIQLPFVPRDKLWGLIGWQYIQGWYKVDGVLMYVNRGIGMINPAIRFRCRPEVTLFILHPSKDSEARLIR